MHIREELLKEHSKPQAEYISNYIGNNLERFDELLKLFTGDEYRVTQRAAMTLSKCVDKHPELLIPHLERLILNLKKDKVHVAVKRNTLRVLQDVAIPERLWGETADICFNTLLSKDEPIAVKVFAMTILSHIAQKLPDLKNELRIIIEDQMPYGSAGFRNRGAKILKKL